jgi:hypothetical protein
MATWPGCKRPFHTVMAASAASSAAGSRSALMLKVIAAEMPRSRSIAIQSERARHRSPRALTSPTNRIAPPNSNFSVTMAVMASECGITAKVRRHNISSVRLLINPFQLLLGCRLSNRAHEPQPSIALFITLCRACSQSTAAIPRLTRREANRTPQRRRSCRLIARQSDSLVNFLSRM